MSDFTPITTQEEFDKAVSGRIAREREKYADYDTLKATVEKYKDYDKIQSDLAAVQKSLTDAEGRYAELEAQSKEKDTKIAAFEASALKLKVAIDNHLPYEMHKYLQGSTEEELIQSAGELLKFGGGSQGDPDAQAEKDPPKNKKEQAMKDMLKQINGGK